MARNLWSRGVWLQQVGGPQAVRLDGRGNNAGFLAAHDDVLRPLPMGGGLAVCSENVDSHDGLWLSNEIAGTSFHVFVMFILGSDGQVHPGMNAALEARGLAGLQAHARAAAGWNEQIVWARRLGNEVAINHLRAFGCWGGRACSLVQDVNKAAAESFHAGKSVSLTAQIL